MPKVKSGLKNLARRTRFRWRHQSRQLGSHSPARRYGFWLLLNATMGLGWEAWIPTTLGFSYYNSRGWGKRKFTTLSIWNTKLILLLFIDCYIIFQTNNGKSNFAPPCIHILTCRFHPLLKVPFYVSFLDSLSLILKKLAQVPFLWDVFPTTQDNQSLPSLSGHSIW